MATMRTLKYFDVPSRIRGTTIDEKKAQELQTELDTLKEKFARQQGMTISFSHADKEGNLETVINGFRFILPNEDILGGEAYDPRFAAHKLVYTYEVVITSIDEAKKEVRVSYSRIRDRQRKRIMRKIDAVLLKQRAERNEISREASDEVDRRLSIVRDDLGDIVSGLDGAQSKTRRRVRNALVHSEVNDMMEESDVERIIVPAIIKAVTRDEAYLDILGYGIRGYMPKFYYTYSHIQDLRNVIHSGDIVDVEIIGQYKGREHKGLYTCARTPIIENPWKNLNIEVNDTIIVTAAGTTRTGWFGMLEGCEIEVYCEFPKAGSGFEIISGEKYCCRLYRKDVERRNLKARVLFHVEDRHKG